MRRSWSIPVLLARNPAGHSTRRLRSNALPLLDDDGPSFGWRHRNGNVDDSGRKKPRGRCDAALVYLDRDELPEVVVVVLSPKGRYRVPHEAEIVSGWGRTALNLRWHVVELWTIPAEELLAVPEVGAVPWALLGRMDGPPEPFFRRCRERIDREAAPEEHENLLAVSQVLARLRYDDEGLFRLLGGEQTMLELPFLEKFKEEWAQEAAQKATRKATHDVLVRSIVKILATRFNSRAKSLEPELAAITDEAQLEELQTLSVTCTSLKEFRAGLRDPSGSDKKS